MRFPKRSFARPSAIAATAIALAALASAHADQTWTGATDSDFNTGSNYLGGTWAEWTSYAFDSNTVNGTINVDETKGWGNLSLNSGLATDISIGGPGIIHMAPAKLGQPGWAAPSLGGTITIASDSKNLSISNRLIIDGGLTWNVGAGRTLTTTGSLEDWPDIGTTSLEKQGAGTAILAASNSYTGGTTITGGTLRAVRSSLGTGSVVVNNGGIFYLNDQWVLCGANPYGVTERNIGTLTINAGGTLELDAVQGFVNGATNLILNGGLITGGPNDFRGDLFLWNGNQQITVGGAATSTIASIIGVTGNNNTITVNADSTLNLTGGIKNSDWYDNGSSPGGIIKAGPGTLNISGSSSYSGTTAINSGILQIGDGGTSGTLGTGPVVIASGASLIINRSDDYSLSSGQSISGAGSLIKNGSGTLTLPSSYSFTGGIILNEGTLKAGAHEAFGASGTSFALNDGSINLNGYTQTLAAVTGSTSSSIQGGTDLISMLTLGSGNTSSTFAGALSGNLALVKIGTGTLTITGSVTMNGIITAQEGTLDISTATLASGVRINTSKLAIVKLPTASISKLYIDNVKLSPGRWGAPGSVAANLADFESPAFSGPGVVTLADTGPSSQERWKTMKHGFFVHYVWDGFGGVTLNADGSNPTSINDVADRFDAPGFADDMESMGVEYVIFTAWHANFFPMYPSSAMAKYHSGRSPNRDMIGDMITAVRAKNIRVLLYTHPWQPINWSGDVVTEHNNLINDVHAELIDRYGDRIDGLFLDENFVGGNQDEFVDYPRLLDTIRRRNPELVLMHNWSGNIYNSDMMHRETPVGADLSANPWVSWTTSVPSTQLVAPQWFTTVPKVPAPAVSSAWRSPEGIFRSAVLGAGSCTLGGGWIWGAGPYTGDGHWPAGSTNFIGRWETGVLEAMQGAAAHIAPIAASIKNTYPSSSWLIAPETHILSLPQGIVATRSTDDTKEYIHVLNPPGTRTLRLPSPADGKVFTNARLMKNNRAVTLTRSARGISLTLANQDNWETLNTVIVMDVASPGERALTNNNSPAVTYTGAWTYSGNRGTTEYGQDVHETSANGDFLEFAFNGTDVELIGTCASDRGTADIYINDVFQETIDLYSATTAYRLTVFSKSGLPRGAHILKVVKTGGSFLTVDAFRVTELINSDDPSLTYSGTWTNKASPDAIGGEVRETNTNNDSMSFNFEGNGIDVIASKGVGGGTVRYSLNDAYSLSAPQASNFTQSQALVFTNSDTQTLNNGLHKLTVMKLRGTWADVDAFRIYKGTSTPALRWGASGAGGTATWNVNNTANWYDGSAATQWQDFGGTDYAAIFGGTAGTVSLGTGVKANNLTFDTTGYLLQTNSLTLNGLSPAITTSTGVTATIASMLSGSSGLTKAGAGTLSITGANIYTGATSIAAGTLTLNGTYASTSFAIASGAVLDFNANTLRDLPAVTLTGTGTLRKTGSNEVSWGASAAVFAMGSGSLIDVQAGTFKGGSWANENWTSNLSDLNVASGATFAGVEANVRVDALTGSGTISSGFLIESYSAFTFGVDNGSGTFNGSLTSSGNYIKAGTGAQTLAGSNTYSGSTRIDGGKLIVSGSMSNTSSVTIATGAELEISGSLATTGTIENNGMLTLTDNGSGSINRAITGNGGLTKSGAGTWSLTNANTYTGNTTVNGGVLSLGNGTSPTNLADAADVIVAADAMLHLDYSGTDQINALWVDGSQLSPGEYSSTSGFITGSGTLTVTTGPASSGYATWSGSGGYNLTEGPSGDDDNDGIANLLEYVLGGDPRTTSNGILPTATATAGNLVFTFRRIQSTTADTTQVFQYGANLSGWTDVPVVAGGMVAIQPDTPQDGTDTVTITVPEGTEPRIFGRLKVSTLPAQP